jgi:hypothetical protein
LRATSAALLNEEFSSAPAGMPVVRQIRFGFPRVGIEERAHPLDRFEIQIGDIA